MVRKLIARLYHKLSHADRAPQTAKHARKPGKAHRPRLHVEDLESRLTPSYLLPAFYQDLLHRAPDAGAAGFNNRLDSGVSPVLIAYEIETAASNEYRYGLVQSYFDRFLHRPG